MRVSNFSTRRFQSLDATPLAVLIAWQLAPHPRGVLPLQVGNHGAGHYRGEAAVAFAGRIHRPAREYRVWPEGRMRRRFDATLCHPTIELVHECLSWEDIAAADAAAARRAPRTFQLAS